MRNHSVELGIFLYISRCHPPRFPKSPSSSAMSRREVTLRVFLPAENGGPRDASALKKMEKRLTLHDFTMIFQLGVAKIYLSEGCWTHYKNLKSGIWPSGEKNWNIRGARNNPKLLRLIGELWTGANFCEGPLIQAVLPLQIQELTGPNYPLGVWVCYGQLQQERSKNRRPW